MQNYLGEAQITDLSGTPFEGFSTEDWAAYWLEEYGQRAEHDLRRAIDSTMRILKGTSIKVYMKQRENCPAEFEPRLGEPSQEYLDFVEAYEEGGAYVWETD